MELERIVARVHPAGHCLAAAQRVCTVKGALPIQQLTGSSFDAICYDNTARRYVSRAAKASTAGRKPLIRLHTDKGPFEMTPDQPVVLEHGGLLPAGELIAGNRLCACEVKPELGYLVRSADFGHEHLDLEHLTAADCAVTNWYPVPSIDNLGEAEVYTVEIGTGGARSNLVIWSVGPGGGIGIVIAV
jgi:hypothetical protein